MPARKTRPEKYGIGAISKLKERQEPKIAYKGNDLDAAVSAYNDLY